MNEEEEEWAKQALMEADHRECVAKVLDMTCANAVPPGTNFVSDIYRLKLKVLKNSGDIEERSVIYKIIPTNSEDKLPDVRELGLFKNEARMYLETLHQMGKLFKMKEPGSEPLWPTFYGVKGDYEAYLMEDLSPYGYKMIPRREELDFEHCKLVLEGLAKFHAGGAVLLERNPGMSDDFKKCSFFVRSAYHTRQRFAEASSTLAEVIRQWPTAWHEYVERLKNLKDLLPPKIIKAFEDEEYSFKTVNHGDLWSSNVLFKYNEEGNPSQIKLLDFQIPFINSACFDIHHIFGTSLKFELAERKQQLLGIYHQSLERFLKLFEYGKDIPTFEDLLQDYEKSKPFQYMMAFSMKPVFMNPTLKELEEIFGKAEDINARFNLVYRYEGEYFLKTIRRTLVELKENDYI